MEIASRAWQVELYKDCGDDPLLLFQEYAVYHAAVLAGFLLWVFGTVDL